jgi:hypothetical protein
MSLRKYLLRRWRYFPYVLAVCIVAAVSAYHWLPQTAQFGRLLFTLPIVLLMVYATWMTVTPCPKCGRRLQAGGGLIWNVYAGGPAKCMNCGFGIDDSADSPPGQRLK